ncbi:MAG: hypothetical protein ACRD6W_09370, partial [Nitrososphaerales archaeon]
RTASLPTSPIRPPPRPSSPRSSLPLAPLTVRVGQHVSPPGAGEELAAVLLPAGLGREVLLRRFGTVKQGSGLVPLIVSDWASYINREMIDVAEGMGKHVRRKALPENTSGLTEGWDNDNGGEAGG